MAGTCVGAGLMLDGDAKVALDGAKSHVWPYGCGVLANNGLNVDPVSNVAWVKPPPIVGHADTVSPPRTIGPLSADDIAIGTYQCTYTNVTCSKQYMRAEAVGGYIVFRTASGNLWAVNRTMSLFVNTLPVLTTGNEPIAVSENNSGGVTSQGATGEATVIDYTLNPGDVAKVVTIYVLTMPDFLASGSNQFYIRPPRISILAWATE